MYTISFIKESHSTNFEPKSNSQSNRSSFVQKRYDIMSDYKDVKKTKKKTVAVPNIHTWMFPVCVHVKNMAVPSPVDFPPLNTDTGVYFAND